MVKLRLREARNRPQIQPRAKPRPRGHTCARSPGRMLLGPATAHGRLWALCRRMGSARAELGSGVPWPTGESWDAWCSMSQGRKLFPCPKRGRCGPGAHGELEDPLGPCPSLRARNAFNHKICSVDLYKYHIPSTAWDVSYVTFTEFEW